MIPASFQTPRALRAINVAAVGVSLAAIVAAVFAAIMHTTSVVAFATGVPTLFLGMIWAAVLRWPKTMPGTSFRVGWAASVPLAILNSSIAAALYLSYDGPGPSLDRVLMGAFVGATFGALFWVPALIGTLICFGLPIAWAQRLARKGLAGEERGEWIVGLVCVIMSTLAIFLAMRPSTSPRDMIDAARPLLTLFAVSGMLTGGTAASLALAREARRRRFVGDAEAGKIEGYRVDTTDEGKVLIRVESQGQGYRVADFEEEIFELSPEGEATRPKTMSVEPD